MGAERKVSRRDYLKLLAAAVIGAPLALGGDCDGKTAQEERLESLKLGEWVSHEAYTIIVNSRGDKTITAINVRSHWDITGKKAEVETLAGTIFAWDDAGVCWSG